MAQREGNKHVHVCHHPAAFTTMPTPRSTGEVGPDRRAHHQFLRNLARVTPIPRTTKA